MEQQRHVLGAMTGTSLDGIDLVLASIEGRGLGMRARIVRSASEELGALAARLRAAAEQSPQSSAELAQLALEFGQLHARVAQTLCSSAHVEPDLASIHGQTIYHRPPVSWQLINPFVIAAELKCPVVYDLRGADIAEGGQGAPLTPLADWVLFRGPEPRAIVNLGGFANTTFLPADCGTLSAHTQGDLNRQVREIRGGDLCACNQLLDRAARQVLNSPFDSGGHAALKGSPDRSAVEELIKRLTPDSHTQSLGTGDEAWETIAPLRTRLEGPALLATLAEAIGTTIGRSLVGHASHDASTQHNTAKISKIIVAGGGAFHERLVRAIATSAGVSTVNSGELGVPPNLREALAWAVLGALAHDGVRVTLPAVTGRTSDVLADGSWCFPAGFRPANCSA